RGPQETAEDHQTSAPVVVRGGDRVPPGRRRGIGDGCAKECDENRRAHQCTPVILRMRWFRESATMSAFAASNAMPRGNRKRATDGTPSADPAFPADPASVTAVLPSMRRIVWLH